MMDSSSTPVSCDGDDARDAAMDVDKHEPAAPAAAGAALTTATAAAPAVSAGAAPAVTRPAAPLSKAKVLVASKAKPSSTVPRRPPPHPNKKGTTTMKKSRLANEGGPATPEASSSGVRLIKSLGFTMKSSPGSGSSNQQQDTQSNPMPESVNDSEAQPIEIDDNEENGEQEEEEEPAHKRKLKSVVWKDFKKVKVMGEWKAKCNYCHKKLGAKSTDGTKHLHYHLNHCDLMKIKLAGQNKTLAQSTLRFKSQEGGKVSVENYTFDPKVARKELAAMISLHEYPLCIVDHSGFRRFVSALQPLFKMVTRNTIRKDILDAFMEEKKRAIDYKAGLKSRVAITTDLWTSENQKRGYMAITAHFIDDSWTLRNIIMSQHGCI